MGIFGNKRGKGLGGKLKRATAKRWARELGYAPRGRGLGVLAVVGAGVLIVGGVAGYAFLMDREIQGGILRQRHEAAQRPDWVSLDSLPDYVPQAVLAVVEPEVLAQGRVTPEAESSTLARELLHQIHQVPRSVLGNSRVRLMGPVLEHRLSPRAMIELYLNRVYLGRAQGYPIYGIYHASREFFDKPPERMTLGEAATLAALLLEPRIEDPQAQAGAVGARRHEVLRVMALGNLISPEEYADALAEPLGFQPGLRQLPMTRPADWAAEGDSIRLPPAWRPSPTDSAAPAPPNAGRS